MIINYDINNNVLYKTISTPNSTIVIPLNLYEIQINPNKSNRLLNEIATITVNSMIFDLEKAEYILNDKLNKTVSVKVNAEVVGQLNIVNGIGQFEFESAETGRFVIEIEGFSCEVIVE